MKFFSRSHGSAWECMILLVNSTDSGADTSDAAERQSGKAWGFEPQVGIVINFCALKGRRE
ncbi:MAG: hypothetical protein GY795_32895, partial [Desulfobacterales bacterium]|nr:hypothetical protein [Desulfobacterales bacterium]